VKTLGFCICDQLMAGMCVRWLSMNFSCSPSLNLFFSYEIHFSKMVHTLALASDSFVRVEVFFDCCCCCWLFPLLICSTPSCDVVQQRRRRPNKQNGKIPRPLLQEPVSEQNGRKAFVVLLCSLFLSFFLFTFCWKRKNPLHFILLLTSSDVAKESPAHP
jgi:hypothetical protein